VAAAPAPWKAIIDEARQRKCDLIDMATVATCGLPDLPVSHRRRARSILTATACSTALTHST
jgi:hypothetical protein